MKVDIKEMKITINSLFLLSILKENIPEEKDKHRIRNYIERQYKKLLPNVFKELPVNQNDGDEKEINILNQNDNNIIIQKKPAIKDEINTNIKNINKNNAFQIENEYKKNPFINKSLNNNDNSKTKKKFIKSNTKFVNINNSIKDYDNKKNMKNMLDKNISKTISNQKQSKINIININFIQSSSKNTGKKHILYNKNKNKKNPFSGTYSKNSV